MNKLQSIGTKFSILILIFILISCSIIGGIGFYALNNNIEELMGEKALSVTKSVAGNIDINRLDRLIKSNNTQDPYYEEARKWMLNINKEVQAEYLYIFTEADADNFQYIIDGSREKGAEGFLDFGLTDPKDLLPQEALIAFEQGETSITEIWDGGEEYGNLVSAFFPVKDSKGEVVAVIGCDINADEVLAKAKSYLPILILSVIITGIILSVIMYVIFGNLIVKPVRILSAASRKLASGDINVHIIQKSKDEIGELMGAFQLMVQNIKVQAGNAEKIAQGDLSLNIVPKSDQDILSLSMKKVVEELAKLVEEVNGLTKAAGDGELKVRANEEHFSGGYRDIVSGMNKTLDVVVENIDEAGRVLHLMSLNDLTQGMNDSKGDLKVLSDSINEVRNRLLAIQELFEEFAKGDTSLLEEYQKVGQRSDNDRLIPSAIAMMTAIRELIKEANMLADAAIEGNLSVRGNTEKFEGGYKEIIEGMNKTMDAIVGPITETAAVLQEMADKDLTVSVNGEYKGEYAKIKEAMNYTIASLNEILGEINASAEQVETGADQVAASSQNLSQGSSEQAGSVEEISASITQVAEQTKENAQNAAKANDLSARAKEDAQNGNSQMEEMLKAMNEIKESSKNISNIIKVIDEIAFQTNILALNAAVEAARAGEHGKGFAVVAEEVRNLAARSAKAASETTELIDSSISKVEEGYEMANATAEALTKIVAVVSDSGEVVNMIANASNEQANAINEINQGIEQISQVTQSNTATAEESASASEEMAGQAQMLKTLIQEFRLEGTGKKLAGNTTENKKIKKSSKEDDEKALKIELDDDSFGKY